MKANTQSLIAALLTLTGTLTGCQAGPPAVSGPAAATGIAAATGSTGDRLLAGLDGEALARVRTLGIAAESLLPQKGIYRLSLPGGTASDWTARLRGLAGVRYVEPVRQYQLAPLSTLAPAPLPPDFSLQDFRIQDFRPDDAEYRFQWNLRSIGMEKAWDLAREARSVTVAVIDSGVDPDHPDLEPHLLPLEDIWGEFAGADRLLNRTTGETLEYDGVDGNGHGTHVAGVIAALLNNDQGVSGIAGGGVRLLPIKVTNLTGATDSVLLVEAVRRAIERGADVINMSIGAASAREPVVSRSLLEAIDLARARGITIVAASGNESQRSAGAVAGVTVPAAFPEVIAVGAYNEAGAVSDYSNGGPELDLIAPGGEGSDPILSTWPTYATLENLQRRVRTLDYALASGTSMAAPHVTAVVALLLAREPDLSPDQLRARLIATADDVLEPGYDPDSGYGRLNAYQALLASDDDARF